MKDNLGPVFIDLPAEGFDFQSWDSGLRLRPFQGVGLEKGLKFLESADVSGNKILVVPMVVN